MVLKVGTDRLYSVRNKLGSFFKCHMDCDSKVEFGKLFTYNPNKHFFSSDDKKIIDFLYDYFDDYNEESSKIKNLIKVVKELIGNGHKILLFSTFKTAIDLVKKEFKRNNISSYVIDGSVPSKKRIELVDKFNSDDTNCFLITLKAGGTGLNLTSADVVIHLDIWRNPQAENQATDRAHRIG